MQNSEPNRITVIKSTLTCSLFSSHLDPLAKAGPVESLTLPGAGDWRGRSGLLLGVAAFGRDLQHLQHPRLLPWLERGVRARNFQQVVNPLVSHGH